jgi:hypothetical protein
VESTVYYFGWDEFGVRRHHEMCNPPLMRGRARSERKPELMRFAADF